MRLTERAISSLLGNPTSENVGKIQTLIANQRETIVVLQEQLAMIRGMNNAFQEEIVALRGQVAGLQSQLSRKEKQPNE